MNKLAIRRQIKSIQNTKKMTKAMELVSASKMRKAITAVLATRPYARECWELLHQLGRTRDADENPLMHVRPVKNLGFILVSTNRGLCGGFNNTLMSAAHAALTRERAEGAQHVMLYTLGKRGRDMCARAGHTITADFPKKDITTSIDDIIPLLDVVRKRYCAGELDKVLIAYMDFISSVKQKACVRQLLPFHIESQDQTTYEGESRDIYEYTSCDMLFEPSPSAVLSYCIPRILEMQAFQAVLESEASEQSARMLAMHNASEAAGDMLFDLQLTYNQARQAAITQEIAEISSGRAALE